VCRRLLAHPRVNPNNTSGYMGTPMRIAAASNHCAVVKLLILAGGCVDAPDAMYLRSPLHAAAAAGHTTTARVLIRTGFASCTLPDSKANTPQQLARSEGHTTTANVVASEYAWRRLCPLLRWRLGLPPVAMPDFSTSHDAAGVLGSDVGAETSPTATAITTTAAMLSKKVASQSAPSFVSAIARLLYRARAHCSASTTDPCGARTHAANEGVGVVPPRAQRECCIGLVRVLSGRLLSAVSAPLLRVWCISVLWCCDKALVLATQPLEKLFAASQAALATVGVSCEPLCNVAAAVCNLEKSSSIPVQLAMKKSAATHEPRSSAAAVAHALVTDADVVAARREEARIRVELRRRNKREMLRVLRGLETAPAFVRELVTQRL